ncbi:MAG: hypothetical protein ACRD68_06585 [Pyrinomonadaceae bacterium]
MTTKKYRAATMREALEQIRQELGEEALVVDSRRVRAGGFLGVGAKEIFEVSVAAEPSPAAGAERAEAPKARSKSGYTSLNLSEDAPAVPARPAQSVRPEQPAATPGGSSSILGDELIFNLRSSGAKTVSAQKPASSAPVFNGIELAETAPRVVHRPKANKIVSAPDSNNNSTPQAEAPAAPQQRQNSPGEFERLRAELREVKFYLGALTARMSQQNGAAVSAVAAEATSEEARPKRAGRVRKNEAGGLKGSPNFGIYTELLDAGLPHELAERVARAGVAVTTDDDTMAAENSVAPDTATLLAASLPSIIQFGDDPLAARPGRPEAPSAVAFIGATGVGKTTTIAKLAARAALRERRPVELITLDTYRIGAIDQLKTYAEIIGAGFNVARSVLELDALVTRLSAGATVLVDTLGRSPHDLADQMELADYLSATERVRKCLVLQATTHPLDAAAAVKKFALYGADCLAVTKLDETARPGASVGVAADAALPLLYLCAGQRVPEDLERATPEALAARVLRDRAYRAALAA